MPETTTTEPAVSTEADKSQGEPVDPKLGENGEKALKAERTRATAAERERDALKAELDKIAAANLSELERAQKAAVDAQALAAKAQADAVRYQIAAESGINENVDLILTGADEETMRAQAKLWNDRAPSPSAPRADLTQGGKSDPAALNSDGLEDALREKLGIA